MHTAQLVESVIDGVEISIYKGETPQTVNSRLRSSIFDHHFGELHESRKKHNPAKTSAEV